MYNKTGVGVGSKTLAGQHLPSCCIGVPLIMCNGARESRAVPIYFYFWLIIIDALHGRKPRSHEIGTTRNEEARGGDSN